MANGNSVFDVLDQAWKASESRSSAKRARARVPYSRQEIEAELEHMRSAADVNKANALTENSLRKFKEQMVDMENQMKDQELKEKMQTWEYRKAAAAVQGATSETFLDLNEKDPKKFNDFVTAEMRLQGAQADAKVQELQDTRKFQAYEYLYQLYTDRDGGLSQVNKQLDTINQLHIDATGTPMVQPGQILDESTITPFLAARNSLKNSLEYYKLKEVAETRGQGIDVLDLKRDFRADQEEERQQAKETRDALGTRLATNYGEKIDSQGNIQNNPTLQAFQKAGEEFASEMRKHNPEFNSRQYADIITSKFKPLENSKLLDRKGWGTGNFTMLAPSDVDPEVIAEAINRALNESGAKSNQEKQLLLNNITRSWVLQESEQIFAPQQKDVNSE